MMSALADPEDVLNAMREKCDAYILKPFDPEKFLQKI